MRVSDDLALLRDAARQAGEVALGFAETQLEIIDKPDGAGPVTQADIAVNDRLEEVLRGARPGYGWLSEESAHDPARATAEAVFVVDPIDGTRSFIDRSRTWAVSVAVVRGGVPVAGVVHLPARGITFSAAAGHGAFRDDLAIAAARPRRLAEAEVLTTRPNLAERHWSGPLPEFRRAHRPSLAYRMCLVAEGRFDAMFTFRPSWEWDIAAGAVICAEAGAHVRDGQGAALRFNNAHPQTPGVMAASGGLMEEIVARRAGA